MANDLSGKDDTQVTDSNARCRVYCADRNCIGASQSAEHLICRVGTDLEVPAVLDEEGQRIFCSVNEGACKEGALLEVRTKDGTVLFSTQFNKRAVEKEATDVACCEVDGGDLENAAKDESVFKHLSFLDRYLVVWVLGSMVLGTVLGYFVPGVQEAWTGLEIDSVSLPIAIGLWLMMYPVLCKVRYGLLGVMFNDRKTRHLMYGSIGLNWVLGPALMTGLAWATLPDKPDLRTGVILVGLARCIAMVLIWNTLANGDPELCAVMVAVNSILQILLYAPLAIFYLQVVSQGDGVDVGFWQVAKSVLLFLGVPLVAAIITRYLLLWLVGPERYEKRFLRYIGPVALLALLYTIVVLFSSQAHNIIDNIGDVFRVAVPLLLYFFIMFFVSLWWSLFTKTEYAPSVTQAFTASSNNFELAIAVAVATFGVLSPQALSATVGPLIEVPVLLGLVYVVLWLRPKWWK